MKDCPKYETDQCPNTKKSGTWIGCIDKEYIIAIVAYAVVFTAWVIGSIYSTTAKADRVIAIEAKVDYIYSYLIERKGK